MKKVLFAVAAVMMIAACAKEETPEQKVNKGSLSFSATMEQPQDAAKSTLVDGTQVSWKAGDEVCVYHWNGTPETVTYAGFTAEADGTSTTFNDNPAHKQGLESLTDGDIAIYPFHEGNVSRGNLTDAKTVTFTTTENQTYVPNSFPAGANVAVGVYTDGTVNFKNVFGVLKLSLTGDKKIKSIKIEDNDGKNLTGDFSVDMTNPSSPVFTQTGGSDYILLNCGEEGVQLNASTPTCFYIVVPAGAFAHGFTATVTPMESGYKMKRLNTNKANIINRSHVRAMPAQTIKFLGNGYLNGIFTVNSSNTKVYFSSGLLQAKFNASSSSYTFQIAESQLEYVGAAAGNTTIKSQTDGAILDLFGWPANNVNTSWGISTSTNNADYAGPFVDWASHESLDCYEVDFRTPSSSWWEWIFWSRQCAFTIDGGTPENNRYALVKVNDLAGVLLFPDKFGWETDTMGEVPGTFNTFPEAQDWNNVNYSLDQFDAMESAGVVFLPAVGERNGNGVSSVGTAVRYASSTANGETNMKRLFVNNNSVSPSHTIGRFWGQGVRLVSVIE